MTLAADLQDALEPLAQVLQQLGIRYYIGGSVASSAHGLPRTTQDVDMVLAILPMHIQPLTDALQDEYYIDADMIRDALRHGTSFNLIHLATMLKLDVFPLKQEPFAQQAFQRAQPLSMDFGERSGTLVVESAEDVILHKLRWYVLGNRVSERQWLDVLGVLKVQGDSIDREYLTRWARLLDLDELLEEALSQAFDTE